MVLHTPDAANALMNASVSGQEAIDGVIEYGPLVEIPSVGCLVDVATDCVTSDEANMLAEARVVTGEASVTKPDRIIVSTEPDEMELSFVSFRNIQSSTPRKGYPDNESFDAGENSFSFESVCYSVSYSDVSVLDLRKTKHSEMSGINDINPCGAATHRNYGDVRNRSVYNNPREFLDISKRDRSFAASSHFEDLRDTSSGSPRYFRREGVTRFSFLSDHNYFRDHNEDENPSASRSTKTMAIGTMNRNGMYSDYLKTVIILNAIAS